MRHDEPRIGDSGVSVRAVFMFFDNQEESKGW
jgi:hypothetical protein